MAFSSPRPARPQKSAAPRDRKWSSDERREQSERFRFAFASRRATLTRPADSSDDESPPSFGDIAVTLFGMMQTRDDAFNKTIASLGTYVRSTHREVKRLREEVARLQAPPAKKRKSEKAAVVHRNPASTKDKKPLPFPSPSPAQLPLRTSDDTKCRVARCYAYAGKGGDACGLCPEHAKRPICAEDECTNMAAKKSALCPRHHRHDSGSE